MSGYAFIWLYNSSHLGRMYRSLENKGCFWYCFGNVFCFLKELKMRMFWELYWDHFWNCVCYWFFECKFWKYQEMKKTKQKKPKQAYVHNISSLWCHDYVAGDDAIVAKSSWGHEIIASVRDQRDLRRADLWRPPRSSDGRRWRANLLKLREMLSGASSPSPSLSLVDELKGAVFMRSGFAVVACYCEFEGERRRESMVSSLCRW